MGWNFSQGRLWDNTVARRHWKQKGTPRPCGATTKASLSSGPQESAAGAFLPPWGCPLCYHTLSFPFLVREEASGRTKMRQGDVRAKPREKKEVGLGDRKQESGGQMPTLGCVQSLWSPHAPVEEYRQLGLKGDQGLYVLHCFRLSKDLGSKQGTTSGPFYCKLPL